MFLKLFLNLSHRAMKNKTTLIFPLTTARMAKTEKHLSANIVKETGRWEHLFIASEIMKLCRHYEIHCDEFS